MSAFTAHCQVVPLSGIIAPRPVTVSVCRPNPVLLSGDKAAIAAFADRQIELERQREADAASEAVTEAQRFPTRPNPHDD